MNRLKAEGRKLGRPVGTFYQESYKLYGKEGRILAYMNLGLSWTKIGKRLRCHHQTVQRYVEKYMPEYTNFNYLNPATFPKAREEV